LEYQERHGKPIILSANLDQILMQGDLSQNITPSLDFLLTRPAAFRTNYMLDQNAMRW
jgi:hypothetical protein